MFYKLTQELGIQYAITFETADVYINGKYNGTYLVTSKVESGSNRVEIADDDYLMEIDINHNKEISTTFNDMEEECKELIQSLPNPEEEDENETIIHEEQLLEQILTLQHQMKYIPYLLCSCNL